jgi:hypothetical protein
VLATPGSRSSPLQRHSTNNSRQFFSMQSKGQGPRAIQLSYHNGDHYNRQAMTSFQFQHCRTLRIVSSIGTAQHHTCVGGGTF